MPITTVPGHVKSEEAKHQAQLPEVEAQGTCAVSEYNKQLETYFHLGEAQGNVMDALET